jgi:hypothetical protein
LHAPSSTNVSEQRSDGYSIALQACQSFAHPEHRHSGPLGTSRRGDAAPLQLSRSGTGGQVSKLSEHQAQMASARSAAASLLALASAALPGPLDQMGRRWLARPPKLTPHQGQEAWRVAKPDRSVKPTASVSPRTSYPARSASISFFPEPNRGNRTLSVPARLCFCSEDFEGADGVGRQLTADIFGRKAGQFEKASRGGQAFVREVRLHMAFAKPLKSGGSKKSLSVKFKDCWICDWSEAGMHAANCLHVRID